MKRIIALLIALLTVFSASLALAAGNATIAVRGRDGFNDYVENLFVWDGKLMLFTYNKIYAWTPEDGLTEVEGYERLIIDTQTNEDGDYYAIIGDEEFELDEDENIYLYSNAYAAGDKLYKIAGISGEDGMIGTLLVEVIIGEDGTFALGDYVDMGDALLEDWGDGYYGVNMPETTCYLNGVLYGMCWGMNGRELVAIDTETGDVDAMTFDTDGDVASITPYDEGRLLLTEQIYEETLQTNLLVYDMETEEITNLGALPTMGWDAPMALCYDEARDKMYYVLGGSVWRVDVSDDGVGEAEEFGDMPLDIWSDSGAVMYGDLYILCSYYGVLGRDVTAEKLPEKHLVVVNDGYVDGFRTAYFDFTAVHPEYMVSIRSDNSTSDIVTAMKNQSSDADIYTMRVSQTSFKELKQKRYMVGLSDNKALSELVGSMYPVLTDLVSDDGEIYAVPMEMYSRCMALNRTVLTEKLGYSEDELPTTFVELFELIADLADGKMEEFPELQLFGPGYTRDQARNNAFSYMFTYYMLWLDSDDANTARSSEVLLELCEAFEKIDWDGFGLPEEYEDNSVWEWRPEDIVMDQESLNVYNYYGDENPMAITPLAIVEGEEAMFPMEVTVAFVNPYSENREAAVEYLQMAAELISETTLITMSPEHNEPIENTYYQENIDWYEKYIGELEESLAQAEADGDDEMVAAYTENLESIRENYEQFKEYGRWNVSPESIATYRELAEKQTPSYTSIWQDNIYGPYQQYLDGAIDMRQFVRNLAEKLQMQRDESM